jgi:hypothetical protein
MPSAMKWFEGRKSGRTLSASPDNVPLMSLTVVLNAFGWHPFCHGLLPLVQDLQIAVVANFWKETIRTITWMDEEKPILLMVTSIKLVQDPGAKWNFLLVPFVNLSLLQLVVSLRAEVMEIGKSARFVEDVDWQRHGHS